MNKRQIREYRKLKRQMENIKLFFGLSAIFVLIPGLSGRILDSKSSKSGN